MHRSAGQCRQPQAVRSKSATWSLILFSPRGLESCSAVRDQPGTNRNVSVGIVLAEEEVEGVLASLDLAPLSTNDRRGHDIGRKRSSAPDEVPDRRMNLKVLHGVGG